jgi:hypothetical protein
MNANYEAPHSANFSIVPLLHPSQVQIFPSTPCSQTPSVHALPLLLETKFHTHTKQLAEFWFVYLTFKFLDSRREDRRL